MRTAAMFCRNARRLSSIASQGSSGLVARPVVTNTPSRVGRMDATPVWCVESRGAVGALVQLSVTSRVWPLRFVSQGTYNEDHANVTISHDEHEDEAKTDEHPEDIIEKASHELFRQSNIIGDSEETDVEEFQVREHPTRAKPGADIANEVWSAKEQDGTSVFTDHSDKVKHDA